MLQANGQFNLGDFLLGDNTTATRAHRNQQLGTAMLQMGPQLVGGGASPIPAALMTILGGLRTRRADRASDEMAEAEKAKKTALMQALGSALAGGDPTEAMRAAVAAGDTDAAFKLYEQSHKAREVPAEILSRYTPESIQAFTQGGGKDYTQLRSIPQKPDLAEGFMMGADGRASVIPGMEEFVAAKLAGARKGDGTSITITDGRQQPTKETTTATQKSLMQLAEQAQRMDALAESYADNQLGYAAKARGAALELRDKASGLPIVGAAAKLSKDDQKFLADRTRFTQEVERMFNSYRVATTGAGASTGEIENLRKSFLNSDLSPTQFRSAYATLRDQISTDIDTQREMLSQGIPVEAVHDYFKARGLPEPSEAAGSDKALAGAALDKRADDLGVGKGSGIVKVNSIEEANKLPKGTRVMLPNGRTGTVD